MLSQCLCVMSSTPSSRNPSFRTVKSQNSHVMQRPCLYMYIMKKETGVFVFVCASIIQLFQVKPDGQRLWCQGYGKVVSEVSRLHQYMILSKLLNQLKRAALGNLLFNIFFFIGVTNRLPLILVICDRRVQAISAWDVCFQDGRGIRENLVVMIY